LQNEAGKFVAPTMASINAGLNDGTWSNGVWTASYKNSSDGAAYAMPTVLYAVVPKSASISVSDKESIQSLLNAILNITGNTNNAASLPTGIVPLTSAVATTAKDEVANGVGNPSYVVPAIGQVTSTKSAHGSSIGGSGSLSSSLQSLAAGSGAGAGGNSGKAPTPSSSPTYGPITLTATESRLIIPAVTGLGGIFLVVGIGMIASSVLVGRRARRIAAPESELEGDAS